jgi:predicted DNA binding CopG/RHH family protein
MKKNEESDLLESIEKNEWVSIKKNKSLMIKKLKETAHNTMLKDQRMNIRIGKKDLDGLKVRAMEEGIPYQTLVSSIIHKYINGKLKEEV